MFKTSYLDVSKFDFLSFCLFHTKNPNRISILLLTPKLKLRCFENGVILELGVKLIFFVQKRQNEKKPKFDTPK
jgi:hypothetical protein